MFRCYYWWSLTMDENDLLGAVLEQIDSSESVKSKVSETECDAIKPVSDGTCDDKNVKNPSSRHLSDIGLDFCFKNNDTTDGKSKFEVEKSVVHSGDTDSSEDEQNKYFEEAKYSSFGLKVKKLLEVKNQKDHDNKRSAGWNSKPVNKNVFGLPETPVVQKEKNDVCMEPTFGIRIVNPLVSSQKIREKMTGKAAIAFSKVQAHVAHGELKNDWVIGGVIVSKSPPKVSQKGSTYLVWTLSDLKLGLKTVAVFLFGRTYEKYWKTPVGTVLGILNPNVLGNKDNSRDEATLSIFNPDQVMIWGQSKDLGWCKSKKKNGDACGSFVNISQCEFCVYHVQSEYRKFNGRSELQSPTCHNMNTSLRNKVLGKNEVFYGGKSFTALPPKKTSAKDGKILNNLGIKTDGLHVAESPATATPIGQRTAGMMEMLNKKRTTNDRSRLSALENKTANPDAKSKIKAKLNTLPRLSDPSSEIELEIKPPVVASGPKSKLQKHFNSIARIPQENCAAKVGSDKLLMKHNSSPKTTVDVIKTKSDGDSNRTLPTDVKKNGTTPVVDSSPNTCRDLTNTPKNQTKEHQSEQRLEKKETPKNVVLTSPVNTLAKPKQSSTPISRAKLKALAYIKQKGAIAKEDPQGSTKKRTGVKRFLESEETDGATEDVNHNVFSERFLELMKMETSHKELIKLDEYQKEMEYYDRMEKKEQMQEKMMTTYQVECKLVRCLKCKYTWFSASDACKADQHPLKVFTGLKRFFECIACSNRTVAVTFLPLIPCSKCGETKWQRAAMMKERIVRNGMELSVRGGEEKFMNSVGTNMNLNLLVPE